MKYVLHPSQIFLEQIIGLSSKGKRLLEKKFLLVLQNPFRYKSLRGYGLQLFRIRLRDQSRDLRVVYFVQDSDVFVVCILDRKNDYRDLRDYLLRLGFL